VSRISRIVGTAKPFRTAWHHAVPVSSRRRVTVISVSVLDTPVMWIDGGVRSRVVIKPSVSLKFTAVACEISFGEPTLFCK